MIPRLIETVMNLLLSALMVVFFLVLSPIWTVFYGGMLLKDYLAAAKA